MLPLRILRFGCCLGLLALAGCGPDAENVPTRSSVLYQQLLRTIYRHTVPTVPAVELARELQQPAPPLLLDARTPAELRVSHLAGAQFVDFDSVPTAQFADLDRARPVVVYCSVGLRSERLGERLHALGFRQVRNLYGGLFEWVNEGHPVVNEGGVTDAVHPYSTFWGSWLRRGRKVYE
ncbi:rhodanese-like domain-containing protein [Hymenobacter sp. DH14]|uniref:Rhodanese-like domain-containing protein n=1 Tax=Hymenobacter cyanobacteriorum TaxID=2926463 RepID=A0A9X1VFE1_9BACT|nr:rhodanese-like domain-containing protein [Hymenobacter cyanobacteriorum]MCI1187707.1 rhodanese-like domain-containing protein [Hymenobacter cyanobacteriorum]